MLKSIKQLYKNKLGASDGEIGHVKDFYFDDQNWAVRYVVADTGSWMPGRLVLISPRAFGDLHQGENVLLVNLTRQQIEKSPPIESHKPVSRQYEEEYHQYYDWPVYWQGGMLWGMSTFPSVSPSPGVNTPPVMSPSLGRLSDEQSTAKGKRQESRDPHLRSVNAVIGYHIHASDEMIGHVADFVMDNKNWAIQHVVVETKNWLSGKKVMVSPSQIKRISFDESKVYVDLTKEAILKAPAFDPASFGEVNIRAV